MNRLVAVLLLSFLAVSLADYDKELTPDDYGYTREDSYLRMWMEHTDAGYPGISKLYSNSAGDLKTELNPITPDRNHALYLTIYSHFIRNGVETTYTWENSKIGCEMTVGKVHDDSLSRLGF